MTFLEIQDDALEALNLPTDVSSTARTRIKRKINEGYRKILSAQGMGKLRDSTTTISVIAGTSEYTVTAAKILYIRDASNDVRLEEVSLGDLRVIDPGDDSTGNPTHYAIRSAPSSTTLKVRLWPEPSQSLTLDVDIQAAVTSLTADADLPLIPADFHHILSVYARRSEYEKSDDTRYRDAKAEFQELEDDLRFYLRKSATRSTVQGGRPRGYQSSLGPTFPDRQ